MEKYLEHIEELIKRYPQLDVNKPDILYTYKILRECYNKGGKLLVAGNGGSAADSEHIVGELMKGFKAKRPLDAEFCDKLQKIDVDLGKKMSEKLQGTLRAISLANHQGLNTAFANDVDGSLNFAQQVLGYGDERDVFLGISTSGNSENVIAAAIVAKAKGMQVVALTGKNKGKLEKLADVVINVPELETYKIQELHLPVYHCLCLMLEDTFFAS